VIQVIKKQEERIEYHTKDLNICIDVGNQSGEGMTYCNLGCAYHSLGDIKKAIEYHTKHLKLCIDIGDRSGEGRAYCDLGLAYYELGDFNITQRI
jgi:tetratricopeptide (TPR) repeat protein